MGIHNQLKGSLNPFYLGISKDKEKHDTKYDKNYFRKTGDQDGGMEKEKYRSTVPPLNKKITKQLIP